MRGICVVVASFSLAPAGWAGDGVGEINQACVSTGCFAGDAPGFPVTLSLPGSYLLTSNLRVTTTAHTFPLVEIDAPDVTLDLGGFQLSCSRPTLPASPCSVGGSAEGNGIHSDQENTTVRNGSVRGMANQGLRLNHRALVENVRAIANGGDGIQAGIATRVSGCLTMGNGGRGIFVSALSNVSENVSTDNGSDGFAVGSSSTVSHNTAGDNGGLGFELGSTNGVATQVGGLAAHNTASSNAGLGMRLEPVWGYRGNVLTNNNGGNANPQASSGINLGQNVCGTDAICP
jgi:hypothetical protein